MGSGDTLASPSGGKDEAFASALEGLSAQEKNARIVDKLMEEEFRRAKSINESDSADEYRYTIEINGPSPAELKELMRIASFAEGTVGESRFFFARNAPPDRPLKEYLLEAFFLQAGNDITKITISAPKKNPRTSSYSTSTRLKGTRTRSVSGGIDEPLGASGRFGKFFEPVDQEED